MTKTKVAPFYLGHGVVYFSVQIYEENTSRERRMYQLTGCDIVRQFNVGKTTDIRKSIVSDLTRPATVNQDVITGQVTMIVDK